MDSVDLNPDEQEEKERLIQQLLELRNTLDGMFTHLVVIYESKINVEPTCVCAHINWCHMCVWYHQSFGDISWSN